VNHSQIEPACASLSARRSPETESETGHGGGFILGCLG
jgi:hypothetical protein